MPVNYSLILLICLISLNALSNEITVSGKLESNVSNSTKSLYLEGKQKSDNYKNVVSFRTIHSYIKSYGRKVKYRALFDYEQISKKVEHNGFTGLYFRHKNDKYKNAKYQNYSIASIGKGKCFNKYICGELFIGQRFAAQKDIYIIRPAISLKTAYQNFRVIHKSSFIKGDNYELIKNKLEIAYQLNKKVSIKYITDIEISQYYNLEVRDKSNILALGVRF